jgi:hypothetical protein
MESENISQLATTPTLPEIGTMKEEGRTWMQKCRNCNTPNANINEHCRRCGRPVLVRQGIDWHKLANSIMAVISLCLALINHVEYETNTRSWQAVAQVATRFRQQITGGTEDRANYQARADIQPLASLAAFPVSSSSADILRLMSGGAAVQTFSVPSLLVQNSSITSSPFQSNSLGAWCFADKGFVGTLDANGTCKPNAPVAPFSNLISTTQ